MNKTFAFITLLAAERTTFPLTCFLTGKNAIVNKQIKYIKSQYKYENID